MFDIIIPILNMKPRYLHDCLNSLKAQQYKKFKCYIIDGSPKDWEHYKESMKVIKVMMKGDKRFEYHRHPNLDEPYVSESQNYGLSLGSNPYVQFLGGDDFFYPHHLISMKDAIDAENDNDVGFWFSMVRVNSKIVLDFQTFKVGRVRSWLMNHYLSYPTMPKYLYPFFHTGNPIYMNGLVLKRELVEAVDGFNVDYQIGEDVDMIMKIVVNGQHGRWLPYVGSYLRTHGGQATDDERIKNMSLEKRLKWSQQLAQKQIDYSEYKIGWKRWKTIDDWHKEVEENGGQPVLEGDGKDKRLTGKELEIEYERLEKIIGTKITPAHYEILRGITSGTWVEKTHFELLDEEKLFLLRDDDEEKKFMENDIVI